MSAFHAKIRLKRDNLLFVIFREKQTNDSALVILLILISTIYRGMTVEIGVPPIPDSLTNRSPIDIHSCDRSLT